MRVTTLARVHLGTVSRLDARYFLSEGVRSRRLLDACRRAGVALRPLGGPVGMASVWAPGRFKRSYAASNEPALPYLRPYDVFDYLPSPADFLSVERTDNISSYQLRKGVILQTCSGRNLGPAVMIDEYLAGFLMSHDMIRIELNDSTLAAYVLAFLRSWLGQDLVKRDKTGSVIDHISVEHVASLPIPILQDGVIEASARLMKHAVRLREEARLKLAALISEFERVSPAAPQGPALKDGWSVRRMEAVGRLDAAFYNPEVKEIRAALERVGSLPVSAVASVRKPGGRYKTMYVGESEGRPILSGGQVLQEDPVNLRFISPKALRRQEDYEVRENWIVYPADGRAEEALGTPALVTSDRSGWLASGHVGRVIPRDGVESGWLYVALRTRVAQVQLKAAASGSVVDSTFPPDMERVLLPLAAGMDFTPVRMAWGKFVEAKVAERASRDVIEREILRLAEAPNE
jgi:hypothetical protein